MRLLIICLSLLPLVLTAQNVEFSGGVHHNSFYDLQKENDTDFNTEYSGKVGYSIAASVSDFTRKLIPMRVTLHFDSYRGELFTSESAGAGKTQTDANVTKYVLGLGVYPIHFTIENKMEFSIGCDANFLVGNSTEGFKKTFILEEEVESQSLESLKINVPVYFGLSGRVSYNFKVAQDWFVTPIYILSLTLSDEFRDIESNPKSIRHHIQVGLTRKL